ncbi:MAG: CpsB/CapC family capsule biosynthesis tyrosine phosphatase, partial [Erysipelotrichaceae bacterium]
EDIGLIHERIQALIQLGESMDIQVYVGSELMLRGDYTSCIPKRSIPLANSRYLLVEFDYKQPMPSIEESIEMLHEIIVLGYTPVIAHVERYFSDHLDINYLVEWRKLGCVMQVNRSSLVGLHGKRMKLFSSEALRKGFVHMVASDAHGNHRSLQLKDAYELVRQEIGSKAAHRLFYENPLAIIQNQAVEAIEPKKQNFFQALFKK